jgi:hypothetical protein
MFLAEFREKQSIYFSQRAQRSRVLRGVFSFFIKKKNANKSKKYSASSASPRTLREINARNKINKEL